MAETRRTEQRLAPGQPALDPERELPPATAHSNPRLNEAAEAIGGALGSATRQAQRVRDRFEVIRGGAQGGPSMEQLKHSTQEKLEELKERAGTAMEQARVQATARLEDARTRASRLAHDAMDSASERVRLIRLRATRLANERPLAVLGVMGAAAFLLGIFLRVRRGKRG